MIINAYNTWKGFKPNDFKGVYDGWILKIKEWHFSQLWKNFKPLALRFMYEEIEFEKIWKKQKI